jgi:hypothetical protein
LKKEEIKTYKTKKHDKIKIENRTKTGKYATWAGPTGAPFQVSPALFDARSFPIVGRPSPIIRLMNQAWVSGQRSFLDQLPTNERSKFSPYSEALHN